MRMGRWSLLAVGVIATACAPTIGPVIPSVQVLVVLDSLDDTLRVIPVDSPDVMHRILLNVVAPKHALALSGQIAAIGLGSSAMTVDLARRRTVCAPVPLDPPGPISALSFADNGFVYAAKPTVNGAPHFDPNACGAAGQGYVRGGPQAFVSARSTFFIVAANGIPCAPLPANCPVAPSWLATSTSQTSGNTPLSPSDSIPLSLPGNAQGAVLAADGFLYVINAGNGRQQSARLSQVDPVQKTERNVYNGFGTLPQYIATDGTRVFVASAAEGLMVYNTATNQVERDANAAIPLFGSPRGLVADDIGRVYVLIAGTCSPAGQGSIRIFGTDLVYKRGVTLGRCPVAIGVTDIPATLYHFDN